LNDTALLFDFIPQSVTTTTFLSFTLNLLGAGISSFLLGLFYTKYGTSLSNRGKMAVSFSALSMTTMLVISIIKSNLALSLGLVGALSIVRFRAAIKEPEELIFLFLNISIGIGFGANQGLVTVFSIPIICMAIYIHERYRRGNTDVATNSLFLTVSSIKNDFDMPSLLHQLEKHCQAVDFKRFSKQGENYQASFIVVFENMDHLNDFQKNFIGDGKSNISIIENTTIFQ
jgi:hypothetical protein